MFWAKHKGEGVNLFGVSHENLPGSYDASLYECLT